MATTDYLRKRFMPHIWCPGCGHGIVLNSLLRAVEKLQIEKNDVVMVSGIGCSSRIQGYTDFHTLHTLHGRALAFATGVKLSRPDLNVLVPMGDGDALAIGGNHFIHAARRNIDMTAIIMNNNIYGMTGGQYSPTTGCGDYATTAPYGSVDRPFDTVALATAAGATFIARTTSYHAREMTRILAEAIRHRGFSVVEVLTQCPTYYGRKNNKGSAVDMMKWYRDNTEVVKPGDGGASAVPTPVAPEPTPASDDGQDGVRETTVETAPGSRIPIGILVRKDAPEYCESYAKLVGERARS